MPEIFKAQKLGMELGGGGGLIFGPAIFWGLCWKPYGFLWVFIFAPI